MPDILLDVPSLDYHGMILDYHAMIMAAAGRDAEAAREATTTAHNNWTLAGPEPGR